MTHIVYLTRTIQTSVEYEAVNRHDDFRTIHGTEISAPEDGDVQNDRVERVQRRGADVAEYHAQRANHHEEAAGVRHPSPLVVPAIVPARRRANAQGRRAQGSRPRYSRRIRVRGDDFSCTMVNDTRLLSRFASFGR